MSTYCFTCICGSFNLQVKVRTRPNVYGEHVVHVFENGKLNKEASAYETSREDAIETAKAIVRYAIITRKSLTEAL